MNIKIDRNNKLFTIICNWLDVRNIGVSLIDRFYHDIKYLEFRHDKEFIYIYVNDDFYGLYRCAHHDELGYHNLYRDICLYIG